MEIIEQIAELKELVRQAKQAGRTVGLVPTMGFLHEGHLTLMRKAKAEQDVVIASIFVNPLQFGPREDYATYPRDIQRDSTLAASAGVDLLFVPTVAEMYPEGPEDVLTYVDVKKITECLCGATRPGHFRGVATVVTKLFNIVQPDVAYFGQKDAQQVVVIKKMVTDLAMNVKIAVVPIVREMDGLAMSSRNLYLGPEERKAALALHKALQLAKSLLQSGVDDTARIVAAMTDLIQSEPLARIDYISITDANSLAKLNKVHNPALVALAVYIGKTRLIDNMVWEG